MYAPMLSFVAVVCLLVPGIARAESPLAHASREPPAAASASASAEAAVSVSVDEVRMSRATDFLVNGSEGTFDLQTNHAILTTIHYPEPIKQCKGYNTRFFEVECKNHTVLLHPRKRKPREQPGNLVIAGASIKTVWRLHPVADHRDAISTARVRRWSDAEALQQTVSRLVAHQLAQIQGGIEDTVRHQSALSFTADIRRRHEVVTTTYSPPAHDEPNDLVVDITGGIYVGDDLHLFYRLQNRGREARHIAELHVFDQSAKEDLAGLISVDDPGAGAKERDLIAIVQPGAPVAGSVVIPNADGLAREPLSLGVMGPGGTQPMWVRNIRVAPLLMRPPPEADRASMYVQPFIGLLLVNEELAPRDQDIVSMAGLSLRFSFAMQDWTRFAFEGELAGARAGTAMFEGVALDGEVGDLERSTAFLRAMGGIRLCFGRLWKPMIHAAIGLQGSSRSTRLRRGDGAFIDGPDSLGLEVPFTLGIGIDRRLSANWVAGARLSGGRDLGGDTPQAGGYLEAGIHLGYYWKVLR